MGKWQLAYRRYLSVCTAIIAFTLGTEATRRHVPSCHLPHPPPIRPTTSHPCHGNHCYRYCPSKCHVFPFCCPVPHIHLEWFSEGYDDDEEGSEWANGVTHQPPAIPGEQNNFHTRLWGTTLKLVLWLIVWDRLVLAGQRMRPSVHECIWGFLSSSPAFINFLVITVTLFPLSYNFIGASPSPSQPQRIRPRRRDIEDILWLTALIPPPFIDYILLLLLVLSNTRPMDQNIAQPDLI